jgi:2-polyprenyl-3-methyl-5-hydroxy-6-metoxy-1,4-benzoquinol methylase
MKNEKVKIKDERILFILNEVKPEDKILHLGCVDDISSIFKNRWLHGYLLKKCKNVLGLDINRDGVEKLQALGYKVIWGDCEKLNLGEKFDVIIAGELIEHLANPGNFLEGVKKHLAPGGKLILSTPNVYYFWNILSIIFRGWVPVHKEHTCWYELTTLTQLLERYGYKVIKLKYIEGYSPLIGKILSMLLCKLRMFKIGACGFMLVCRLRCDEEK